MTTPLQDDPVHRIPATGQLRASRRRWRLATFAALAIAVVAVGLQSAPQFQAHGGQHIARILVEGTIGHDAARLAVLRELEEDDTVPAVVLAINSPGGTTAGGEELYDAIARLREKKPVVAVINELGASAAYMTAISADRILARQTSLVGSIGVLIQHMDAGKLLDTIGVNLDKVASGPLKAEPDITGPIKPEVRASLEALIKDSYDVFVDMVSERRGLTRQKTLSLADGRILSGRQALDAGLIDQYGGEREAVAWLEASKGVAANLPVATVYPKPENELTGLMRFVGSGAKAILGLGAGDPMALDGLVSLWQFDSAS